MITGPNTITFGWQTPQDDGGAPITTYSFTMTPEGGSPQTSTLLASETCYEATELVTGVAIQATVKASNTNGASYGPEYNFPIATPIVAPSIAPHSATAVVVSSGVAEVAWEPATVQPQGSAYYLITSQSSNTSDPIISLGTQDLTQVSCHLCELNPDSDYVFHVSIVNGAGQSPSTTTNTFRFT
jgi:hypothetical protein